MNREEVIFIDRQITDTILRKRMDLLALMQVNGNKYQFLIAEVKLGNNKELKDDVVTQLSRYVRHVDSNFNDYKQCYEQQYYQKKKLGLLQQKHDTIIIEKPVEGKIIVGRYSGIAKNQIDELTRNHPNISVKSFPYVL